MTGKTSWHRYLSLMGATLALIIGTMTPPRVGAETNPGVLPPGSNYGMTNRQWSAKWWQWALAQPVLTSPLLDPNGANCAAGQSGSVWFLAGTLSGGSATRSCTIPASKAVFFPVANYFCSAEGSAAQMRICARVGQKGATNLSAEVDGVSVRHLPSYSVKSPTFDLTLPADNVFGVDAGVYVPTSSDGVYLMLAPLSVGAHVIHFHADFTGGGFLDVTTT